MLPCWMAAEGAPLSWSLQLASAQEVGHLPGLQQRAEDKKSRSARLAAMEDKKNGGINMQAAGSSAFVPFMKVRGVPPKGKGPQLPYQLPGTTYSTQYSWLLAKGQDNKVTLSSSVNVHLEREEKSLCHLHPCQNDFFLAKFLGAVVTAFGHLHDGNMHIARYLCSNGCNLQCIWFIVLVYSCCRCSRGLLLIGNNPLSKQTMPWLP